jgi:hypothetical protein
MSDARGAHGAFIINNQSLQPRHEANNLPPDSLTTFHLVFSSNEFDFSEMDNEVSLICILLLVYHPAKKEM